MKEGNITPNSLFEEVRAMAQEQGANTQEAWDELVDEVVQNHIDSGDFFSGQDPEELKNKVKTRFEEYHKEAHERLHGLDTELADVGDDNNETTRVE